MHAHNDNTPATRPAEFDAMLVQYRPGLMRLAARLGYFGEDGDYLVLDTIAHCLANWQRYRQDGGAWGYVSWQMRNIARNRRAAMKRQRMFVADPDGRLIDGLTHQGEQEYVVDLNRALAHLNSRNGRVLLRRAMGETMQDIADDIGVTRERVRQIEDATRRNLARDCWREAA